MCQSATECYESVAPSSTRPHSRRQPCASLVALTVLVLAGRGINLPAGTKSSVLGAGVGMHLQYDHAMHFLSYTGQRG
jgi:hypothetical protein